MTLPAFSAAGTGSETAPAWPTHATGDFGMLFVETASGTVTTPSGWTLIRQVDHSLTSLAVFYRFATSGAESAPSLAGGFNHLWGVIITFTGVNTTHPIAGRSTLIAVSTTAQSLVGLRTPMDDCMVVQGAAWSADNAGPLSSGETNSDLGSLTERYDAGTITANGGGVIVITGTKASFGNVKSTDITLAVAAALAMQTIALQAADKAFTLSARKSRVVNTRM